jgi:acyl-homoserine lactone synthase
LNATFLLVSSQYDDVAVTVGGCQNYWQYISKRIFYWTQQDGRQSFRKSDRNTRGFEMWTEQTMISVIQAPLDEDSAKHLRNLFAVRYQLFVEGRGWRALERPDRLDIDQYDDDDTVYIVKRIDGVIVGGARLRPTTNRHMLQEVFGDLCDGGSPPVGPTIYECSRTFVARRHPQRRAIFAEVLLAAAQFCLTNGVNRLTGVLETWWLNSYLALGLNATPLGVPKDVDGMSLLAVSFDVDDAVRANLSNCLARFRDPAPLRRQKQDAVHAA